MVFMEIISMSNTLSNNIYWLSMISLSFIFCDSVWFRICPRYYFLFYIWIVIKLSEGGWSWYPIN